MSELKYKVGDKVRIKSIDWYNKNKNEDGDVEFEYFRFVSQMSWSCGKILTIYVDFEDGTYLMKEDTDGFVFTNEMIECKVEEETKNNNDMEEKETLLGWIKESDNLRLVPHKDYEIKHDGDNFYLVKKKKDYPKTYEECCEVLNYKPEFYDADKFLIYGYMCDELRSFQKLLVCRDAYWKIAGEEMGLGKPWEPDWNNVSDKYCIYFVSGDVWSKECQTRQCPFAFPTPEMRDAFKENFDPDIEICKELL